MQRFRALARASSRALLLLLALPCICIAAEQNPPATVLFQGLRSLNHQGSFQAAAFTPDGNLILLYNQGDGIRLLKTDPSAQTLLAQAQLGAAGDAGTALSADPSGNVYVVGYATSAALTGTSNTPYPAPTGRSTNAFVAKFDDKLNLVFLTFVGAPNTTATGVAATADATFVTGSIYSSTLPTTPSAAQPAPATGSNGNGFVERFSANGSTLQYATYLTGAGGETSPTAIAVDTSDHVYIAGSTSAPGFPSVAALQSTFFGPASGFIAELNPSGDSFSFSTFIAGSGLTSVALDPAANNLLATGNIALGQFPIAKVSGPIANTPYQSLLRLSPDGQTLFDSALLLPGDRTAVIPGPNGTTWISGSLSAPPFAGQGAASIGDSYIVHLAADDRMNQRLRFGGLASQDPSYASLTSTLAAPALSPDHSLLILPGTVAAATASTYAGTQTFDLPLTGNAPALLQNTAADLLPTTCVSGNPCSGTGAFLAELTLAGVQPVLSLSSGDPTNFTLRNTTETAVTGIAVSATDASLASNCPTTLSPNDECTLSLTGAASLSLSITAANAPALQRSLSNTVTVAQPLAFDTAELDFGIVTAASSPAARTITVTNLSSTAQTLASAPENLSTSPTFTLTQAGTTCGGAQPELTIPANSTCTITLGLSASSDPSNDGPVRADWRLGNRDLAITGFTQAASLAVSSSQIDFGTLLPTASALPRFLYLSNNFTLPIDHAAVSLPSGSPFTAADNCPSTLQPGSVCQIGLTYHQTAAPTLDSETLLLDQGLTVQLRGETVTALSSTPTQGPSPLQVSPTSVQFSSTVPVSSVSAEIQTVQVTNPTQNTVPLTASVLGDFTLQNTCAPTLPPGTSCDLTLQFTPTQSGTREGLLSVSAGSGLAFTTVPLSGTGTPLFELRTNPIDFGQTVANEPLTRWFQVTGIFPQLTVTSSGAPFSVALLPDDGAGHGTLPPSAFAASASAQCIACWVAVRFLPTTAGSATGTLDLTSDLAGHPVAITLQGEAISATGLLLSPSNNDLGAIPLHSTSAPAILTLTNLLPGAPTVGIEKITTTGDFLLLPATSPNGCSQTLASTASCALQIAFQPTALGPRTGTVVVQTSAGTATANLAASATPDPGLALNPTTLTFHDGLISVQLTLTNTSASPIHIAQPTANDPAFAVAMPCATLSPGQSCSATISLSGSPVSATPLLAIPVQIADPFGETNLTTYAVPLLVATSRAGPGNSAFPAAADFGPQPVNAPGGIRQFRITNTSVQPETLQITASRNFPLSAPADCGTLAPGASCTLTVVFLPQQAGPLTGSLAITPLASDGTPGPQTTIALQGYANAPGTLAANTGADPTLPLNFGQVTSGQSATETLTLTNTGAASVTLRRLSATAPFHITSGCGTTLAIADSCQLTLTYTPELTAPSQIVRVDPGTLLVEADDSQSPLTIYLAGRAASLSTAVSTGALPSYALSQSALTFPNTAAGQISPTQAITVSNNGDVPVVFSAISAPPEFPVTHNCAVLPAGATCTITVAFSPGASTSTLDPAALSLQSNAATALDFVTLLGSSYQTALQLTPASLDFGTVAVGASTEHTITATNLISLPLTLTPPTVQGAFAVTATDCPSNQPLAPNATCTFTLSFAPTTSGPQSSTFSLQTSGSTQASQVALTGTAVAPSLQISPANLSFGTALLGTTLTESLTLTNSGSAGLRSLVLSMGGPAASDFITSSTCDNDIPAAATCTVTVTFAPSSPGALTATLTINGSGLAAPTLIQLTGTGAPPPNFALTVDGTSAAASTVPSGETAQFSLVLTPTGGFSAAVALTCRPLSATPSPECALTVSTFPALTQPAQITAAISTSGKISPAATTPVGLSLLTGLPLYLRRRRKVTTRLRRITKAAAIFAAALLSSLSLASCSGGYAGGIAPGTYQYQVTATSTSGPPLTSTVTLAVTVR